MIVNLTMIKRIKSIKRFNTTKESELKIDFIFVKRSTFHEVKLKFIAALKV